MYGIVKMKSFERVETNVKSEVILIDKLISKVSSIITQKRIEAAIKASSFGRIGMEKQLNEGKRLVSIFRGGTHFKGTGFGVV